MKENGQKKRGNARHVFMYISSAVILILSALGASRLDGESILLTGLVAVGIVVAVLQIVTVIGEKKQQKNTEPEAVLQSVILRRIVIALDSFFIVTYALVLFARSLPMTETACGVVAIMTLLAHAAYFSVEAVNQKNRRMAGYDYEADDMQTADRNYSSYLNEDINKETISNSLDEHH